MDQQSLTLLGIGIWLVALSIILFLFLNFFRRLTKGVKEVDLVKVLEKILKEQSNSKKAIDELGKKINFLEEKARGHVQKVGLVRFNPFKETGGSHSFSLALLDGTETGVVITGLHTRERTRIYIKSIKNGRSELELSEEERKALIKAQREN